MKNILKTKTFKTQLAPNQSVDLDKIEYPILASIKIDGIRCIFKNGEILSRSLKQIQNKQIREKFEPIRMFSEKHNVILDGEIYSHALTFQEIVSYVMTQDFTDTKSIKKYGCIKTIPESLNFHCFDFLNEKDIKDIPFISRLGLVESNLHYFKDIASPVEHKVCNNKKDVLVYYQKALEQGYEGLILRDPKAKYKYGRGTIREGIIFKLKPFITTDAQVISVVQATKVDPNVEKTINELGRSVTSKKVGDRRLIEKASGVVVLYKNKEVTVPLSLTDEEKKEVWENKEDYIGKWIEYKYLEVGMKKDGLPRNLTSVRWRKDKNGHK